MPRLRALISTGCPASGRAAEGGVRAILATSSLVYSESSSEAIWPCASAMLDLIGLNRMACVAGLLR